MLYVIDSCQGICCPVSRDHIAGSGLGLMEVACFLEVDRYILFNHIMWKDWVSTSLKPMSCLNGEDIMHSKILLTKVASAVNLVGFLKVFSPSFCLLILINFVC